MRPFRLFILIIAFQILQSDPSFIGSHKSTSEITADFFLR